MNRRIALALGTTALLGLGTALPGAALAQQKTLKEQLVGTWIFVSGVNTAKDGTKTDPWGANPKGTLMLDGSGHFAQIVLRADLPKLASRSQGTPKQDRAVVKGSLSYYGTYTVDEAAKTINIHYEASSSAALSGTDAKQIIAALNGDELTIINPATRNGRSVEFKWRRAK